LIHHGNAVWGGNAGPRRAHVEQFIEDPAIQEESFGLCDFVLGLCRHRGPFTVGGIRERAGTVIYYVSLGGLGGPFRGVVVGVDGVVLLRLLFRV
jgi:hypothetical protein